MSELREVYRCFWRALADLVLLLHFGFIVFVLVGGFLTIRWRWFPWVHLPAMMWGAAIVFVGWVCPLTPLENWLRKAGGEAGYSGGFIEHYALPLIYPAGLTPQIQVFLGLGVLLVNLGVYAFVFWRRSKKDV